MPAHKRSNHELALIRSIARRFTGIPGPRLALGIGDDCAILDPADGTELLVTTDLLLEDRHFRRDLHSAASAGHRCLARGLSDLAAMGAVPVAAFLSLALPPATLTHAASHGWLRSFLAGMRALARRSAVPLAGGDTGESAGDLLMADIVLVGEAPRGLAMRRGLGRPGDQLYVTGRLGGAAAELKQMLRKSARRGSRRGTQAGARPQRKRGPQQFPQPRIAAGVALRTLGVRTAIDLSDGLSTDLHHLAAASGVHATVEAAHLPLHPLLRDLPADEALRLALHGGEDYELLFAAPPDLAIPAALDGVPLTHIGQLTEPAGARQSRVRLLSSDGRLHPLRPGGWQHFTPDRRSRRTASP